MYSESRSVGLDKNKIAIDNQKCLHWIMLDYSKCLTYKRVVQAVNTLPQSTTGYPVHHVLKSIALVELSQRNMPIRVVERCVDFLLVLIKSEKRLTTGPWQMKKSPLGLKRNAEFALNLLQPHITQVDLDLALREAAALWNGGDRIQAGSFSSYYDALKEASYVVQGT
ncbi:hypothetical protein MN0502_02130 [Arthrobacter sp. MN05-02]|nr:hypothetical protein MN0502_02130 [Arthrobacter sp. MN05-02]